ncbi:MAG: methyl-accepting chemotaxis protein [Veillonellaceae bacterium]|nr:methyl-accepting chemotaxis protein [Veillonellaceae bacterium]
MQELAASARDVDSNQQQLSKGIQGVAEISDKIDDFTSLVRNIAKQTRLLGLNASIEAARAGAAGAGFAVVSDEIGKLANNSNDAVDKIQSFTGRIGEAVNDAVQKGERTADIVDQQSQAIEETAQHLTGLAETASALYDLAHNK